MKEPTENFNENAVCVKCDSSDISASYVPKDCTTNEHIVRYCRRCGYRWKEATLDPHFN